VKCDILDAALPAKKYKQPTDPAPMVGVGGKPLDQFLAERQAASERAAAEEAARDRRREEDERAQNNTAIGTATGVCRAFRGRMC
jgi:hypothetical protein